MEYVRNVFGAILAATLYDVIKVSLDSRFARAAKVILAVRQK